MRKLSEIFTRENIKRKSLAYLANHKLVKKLVVAISRPEMMYDMLEDQDGNTIQASRFSSSVYFYHKERVNIAENVFIWHYTILDGTGGITIEEGCQIGAWVGIFTHSSHMSIRLYGRHDNVAEDEKIGYVIGPVTIGKYTFIGARSIIMPKVKIGMGCIVAAGSFVNTDVPDFAVVEGNPAKVIGDTRRLDARYLKKHPDLQEWYSEWQM